MDFEVPDFIREAIAQRAKHPVYGYTFRPRRFFEAAASWLFRRHGWEVNPDAYSFSPGIVPALNMMGSKKIDINGCISHKYPFEKVIEALEFVRTSSGKERIKVLVTKG